MKQEKIQTERFIAQSFFHKNYGEKINESEFKETNHIKHEPDIIHNKIGLEIGALVSSKNTEKEKFLIDFLKRTNQEISGKIDKNLIVKLYFQINKETLKYRAVEKNSKFSNLTPYLIRIEVLRYKDYSFKEQVCIAQKGLHIEEDFPNFNNVKKFNLFINDLIEIISYTPNKKGDIRGYSVELSEDFEVKQPKEILDKYFNKSILNKFKNKKYKGDFKKLFLILHNYNPNFKRKFTADKHFYSHNKDYIFNKIFTLINKNNSFKFYENVFFLDFSISPDIDNFNLIDFKKYKTKKIVKPLGLMLHIGTDFSCEGLTRNNKNYTKLNDY